MGYSSSSQNTHLLNINQVSNQASDFIQKKKKKKTHNLCVGSWNVRTLNDTKNNLERRTAVLSKVLSTFKVDIVALSETKFPGSGQLKEQDYTFFWSGVPEEEHPSSGVGFAMKK